MALSWDSTWRYSAFVFVVIVTGAIAWYLWGRLKTCLGYSPDLPHGIPNTPGVHTVSLQQTAPRQPYVIVQRPLGPGFSLSQGQNGFVVVNPQWDAHGPQRRPGRLANSTLSPGLLDRMPSFVFPTLEKGDSEEGKGGFERECVVCQEDFGQERVMTVPCGHIFHKGCVRPWLEEHATCPTCRLPITADLLMGRVSFTTDGTPDLETAAPAPAAHQAMTISRNIAWHSNSAAGPGQPIYIWPHRGTVPSLGFTSTTAPGINPTGSSAPPPADAVHFRSFWPRQIPALSDAAAGPSMRRSRTARHSRHGPPAVAVAGDAGPPEMRPGVGRTERHSPATPQPTGAVSGGQRSDAGAAEPESGSGAVELTQAQAERSAGGGAGPVEGRRA